MDHRQTAYGEGMEHYREQEGLEHVSYSPAEEKPIFVPDRGGVEKEKPMRILGLSVAVFWGLLVVLILLVGAAIGTGVGIGLSRRPASSVSTR